MEYKGAIFDMDGLLLDTERVYQQIWQEIAGERGVELGSSFARAVSGTNGDYMCRVIEDYYHVVDGTSIVEECMERVRGKLSVHVPVKKGARDILNFFRKRDIRMAVASSSASAQIVSNLEKADMLRYFTAIVSGMQVRAGKPAPDIFLYAAEQIGCKPSECFVFEDSENGIRAGYAAGCTAIMVPDMFRPSPEILPYCSKVCPDLHSAEAAIRDMLPETGLE